MVRRTSSTFSPLKGLNDQQALAAGNIHGPLLIFAGAGSGKTLVITRRIRHMIDQGIPSSSIVAVTFTNKSAREMKERTLALMEKKKLGGMIVSTFHSLGNRILAANISRLNGYRTPFSIVSADDALNIYSDIYRKMKMDPASVREDAAPFLVSLCKNSGQDPEDFAHNHGMKLTPVIFSEIFHKYAETLRSCNSVDFDDLILLPARIFKKFPEVLEAFRKKHRYFMVDEFQDTNPAQYDLLRQMIGPDRHICVVGDDDQSIYGWRGADVSIILGFQKDFPGAGIVRLELNYRSTQNVIEAANAVIRNNSERVQKTLLATGAKGEKISAMTGESEEAEACLVTDRIRSEIVRRGRKPGDFAILFRTNFQSRSFEQELRKRSLPYHVVGGYKFFDRREVKDMIAYIRFIANEHDELAFTRIINRPKRGIGESSLKRFNEHIISSLETSRISLVGLCKKSLSEPNVVPGIKTDTLSSIRDFFEMIDKYREAFLNAKRMASVLAALIAELKFEIEFLRDGDSQDQARARMMNLSELVNMMDSMEKDWDEEKSPTLFDFLSRVSLLAGDDEEAPAGRVQLMTLHLSKGLEFPVVFLTGMEDGLFPSERSLRDDPSALAEERRLFYVGITRAKEKLFLTASESRKKFGETLVRDLSSFFNEIPVHLLEWESSKEASVEKEQDLLANLRAMRQS